jgi:hypothetical protein
VVTKSSPERFDYIREDAFTLLLKYFPLNKLLDSTKIFKRAVSLMNRFSVFVLPLIPLKAIGLLMLMQERGL